MESTLLEILLPSPSWLIDRAKVGLNPPVAPMDCGEKIYGPAGESRLKDIYLHYNQTTSRVWQRTQSRN